MARICAVFVENFGGKVQDNLTPSITDVPIFCNVNKLQIRRTLDAHHKIVQPLLCRLQYRDKDGKFWEGNPKTSNLCQD